MQAQVQRLGLSQRFTLLSRPAAQIFFVDLSTAYLTLVLRAHCLMHYLLYMILLTRAEIIHVTEGIACDCWQPSS